MSHKPSYSTFGVFYWPWCFALGVILPLLLPQLIPWWVIGGGLILTALLGLRWLLLAFFLGLALAGFTGQRLLEQTLPANLIKKDLQVTGKVLGLPSQKSRVTRFNFQIEQIQQSGGDTFDSKSLKLPSKTRLSWYGRNRPELAAGQRWQFTVRLKPAHGSLNPGAFDYESWLWSRGLRSTGYIRAEKPSAQLDSQKAWLDITAYRARLAAFIQSEVDGPRSQLLTALGVGIRDDLSDEDWQVLQDTGTIHLVAISGLHLGLVAGLFFFIGRFFWRQLFLTSWHFPAHKAGAILSLLVGLIYAALAGFSIPTLRALWMLCTAVLILLTDRNTPLRFNFGLVLALVLLIDPLAPLSKGFWLSFGAVAVILYVGKQQPARDKDRPFGRWLIDQFKAYSRIQVAIFLGLAPVLLYLFQTLSVVSLLANAVAIPVIGFLVVPMVLVAMAAFSLGLLPIAKWIFELAELILQWLWQLLQSMADWPGAVWQMAMPPDWMVVMALFGSAIFLLPPAFPAKWTGLLWFLPIIFFKPAAPDKAEVWLTVLDVGQGLATVIQTRQHTLVYDVGPAYSKSFDAGKDVVLPYLRHQGIKQIDAMVISHANADHIGGMSSVLAGMAVQQRWTSVIDKVPASKLCQAGISWQWDGVAFEFLHPGKNTELTDNNASCVLRIGAGNQVALLTGDIEKAAERQLLQRNAVQLKASLLVMPHHGSKTSSSSDFLEQVKPNIAVVSAGAWNRFKHPHAEVISRYHNRAVQIESTADSGAIRFELAEDKTNISRYRDHKKRYWLTLD